MTVEEKIEVANTFITNKKVTDEDVKQDLYICALSGNGSSYNAIYTKLCRSLEPLEKKYFDPMNSEWYNDIIIDTEESTYNRILASTFNDIFQYLKYSHYIGSYSYEGWTKAYSDRNITIFKLYYLDDYTYAEIGKLYNITSTRVRDISEDILRTLRGWFYFKYLDGFL